MGGKDLRQKGNDKGELIERAGQEQELYRAQNPLCWVNNVMAWFSVIK
jgi:hypothetical protein